jgi:hypothetical protein
MTLFALSESQSMSRTPTFCSLAACPIRFYFVVGLIMLPIIVAGSGFHPEAPAAEKPKTPPQSSTAFQQQKQALAEFNSLIGNWRGVGMPRRGSRKGAWSETAEWVWRFGKDTVAIDYKIEKGKLLRSARVTYNPDRKLYLLTGTFADKTNRSYEGRQQNRKMIFQSKPDNEGYIHLLTVTRLNDKRTLVLYQKRRETSRFVTRVAEVGYTRAGTSLAIEGAGEIECIVTGGRGTIPVTYKGEKYYVCCSGCKTAFDDDPEDIIADYKRKLAKRKNDQAKKK